VPSLRNITQTGPYLHDGSIETLEEMVRIMGRYQLGQALSDAQVADIIAFLDALTGEIPQDNIVKPELPESGPETPAPGGG
jgi:cytochrome c peroxidase